MMSDIGDRKPDLFQTGMSVSKARYYSYNHHEKITVNFLTLPDQMERFRVYPCSSRLGMHNQNLIAKFVAHALLPYPRGTS